MANKSHLKFLNEQQLSEIKNFKYNYGFEKAKDDRDNSPKNYVRLATSFRVDLEKWDNDLVAKYNEKDRTLEIPYDIDYVQITFQDQFVISKYFVSKNMTDPKIEEVLIHNRRNTDSNSYSSFA